MTFHELLVFLVFALFVTECKRCDVEERQADALERIADHLMRDAGIPDAALDQADAHLHQGHRPDRDE
jgi:hypothetical protein